MAELNVLSGEPVNDLVGLLVQYRAALGHEPSCYRVSAKQWQQIQSATTKHNNNLKALVQHVELDALTFNGVPVRQQ